MTTVLPPSRQTHSSTPIPVISADLSVPISYSSFWFQGLAAHQTESSPSAFLKSNFEVVGETVQDHGGCLSMFIGASSGRDSGHVLPDSMQCIV